MTMCRLTVLAPEGAWQGEVSPWEGLVVLAALSAEPESLNELAEAVRRYLPEHHLFDPPEQAAWEEDETDGLWCLVDLVGRTVVAGAGFELPDPRGAYKADEADNAEGFPIVWLDTPADWLFRERGEDWRAVLAERATARKALRRVDARPVLFGRPLLEHLADGVLGAVAKGGLDDQSRLKATRAIHADWLMTARADLNGHFPRELLLADRSRISLDLEHRAQQWSRQGHAATPLSPDATAYRLGGFGTMEVVLYFDLVRALLAEAWELTNQPVPPTRSVLVERLAELRDAWLHQPHEGRETPAELIELERSRMPVASDGSHLFDDCPICQAEAEGDFGPSFMWFDGHHLDLEDEFAFSLCATRAEWDEQQEDNRKFSEEMARKMSERSASAEEGSAWQTSFVNWDGLVGPGASPAMAMMALSFPLAELVGSLQERPNGTDILRRLNEAYAALRKSQDEVARSSAAQELREGLEVVGLLFPDLTARCADLESRLDEVLRLH